jgi:hypothetical protein
MEEGKLCRFHYLNLFGISPVLRDGTAAWDSVGAMLCPELIDTAVEFFRVQKPAAFLFAPMYAKDGTKLQVEGVVAFLDRLKTASPGTKFIYWNGNQQGELDFNVKAFLPFIDAVFTNTDDAEEHQVFLRVGKPVRTFYQFGFDPAEHGRNRHLVPTHGCSFAGSQTFRGRPPKYPNSEWRYRFLCRVAEEFDFALYGKGAWPFLKLGHIVGQRFYDSFASSGVVLGANHWDYVRYYTRRTAYALASGRPYVVRYIPGMEQDFENGRHLIWFTEQDEGLEAIRKLLADPALAIQIGEAGRALAIERFSWAALRREFERLVLSVL